MKTKFMGKGVIMTVRKQPTTFTEAAEIRKKVYDEAVNYYKSRSFQWNEYPKKSNSNTIGKTKSAVYAFFVKNSNEHVEKILTAVSAKKRRIKNNKLPKVNADYKESFKKNGCLYIGSVTSKALETRIKQHWREKRGDVSDSTFALKLCDWINKTEINVKDITVYFCDMTGQTKEIIRAVEDCLATMYRPLLGKTGDSPKG